MERQVEDPEVVGEDTWSVGDRCLWFHDWGWEGSDDGDPDNHWYPATISRVYQVCLNGPDDFHDVVDIVLDNGVFQTAMFVQGIKAIHHE